MADLEIRDLHVSIDGNEILKGITLNVNKGEIHAIMGPNGSGKSTLAYAIMGHPKYVVTKGSILFEGKDLTAAKPNERARAGLFLSFQYPAEIGGVTVSNFLRVALNSIRGKGNELPVAEFIRKLREDMAMLKMEESFTKRYLNEGFSGGEKKRAEILQLAMLQPKMALLDETDSGLDIDALKIVSEGINTVKGKNPDMGVLLITHYQRILNYIKPDFVHVLAKGRIIKSGGKDLSQKLEAEGYGWVLKEANIQIEESTLN